MKIQSSTALRIRKRWRHLLQKFVNSLPYKTPPVMTWKDRRSRLLCFYRNDEAITEGAFKSMRLKGIDASKNKPFLLSADRARFFHNAAWRMRIQIFGAKSTAPNRKNAASQTKKPWKSDSKQSALKQGRYRKTHTVHSIRNAAEIRRVSCFRGP